MESKHASLSSTRIHTDGGSRGNPGPGACAFVFIKDNKVYFKDSKYLGNTTNNLAEYEGVIIALRWLKEHNTNEDVNFYLDSQLVVNQLNGLYKVKNINMISKYNEVEDLRKQLNIRTNFYHIPRNLNKLPDKILNQTIDENK